MAHVCDRDCLVHGFRDRLRKKLAERSAAEEAAAIANGGLAAQAAAIAISNGSSGGSKPKGKRKRQLNISIENKNSSNSGRSR